MKNRVKLLALLIAALFFACACSSATGARAADERVWSDAQRIYRSSSLVVLGECVRAHLNEDGVTCYDLTVGEVLAGRASEGDLIHCADGAMKVARHTCSTSRTEIPRSITARTLRIISF